MINTSRQILQPGLYHKAPLYWKIVLPFTGISGEGNEVSARSDESLAGHSDSRSYQVISS